MSNDLPIDHPNKDFDDWQDEAIDLADEGRKPSPDAANPPSGSDALDDQLDRLNPFDISYNDFVRLKPQVKAALQDLFYTEVLDIIGKNEFVAEYSSNPDNHDPSVRNYLRDELRAKAKAKWGKA